MKARKGTAPRSLGAVLLLVALAILPLARPARTSTSVNQEWAAHYNGPANSHDIPGVLAVDGDGNVYVTGISDGGAATGFDYATVKYNNAGNQLWAARYNGAANGHDFAAALAVDGDGNVYVTGSSSGAGTDNDYATVKYDSAGNQVWEARYNGPGNGADNAAALAIDGVGNIYVTGISYGGVASDYDYATVKYDSAGNQVWATGYNGPASSYDNANSLIVDGGGNVYVTGNSTGVGTQHDYATVKYNSAGSELWSARYNGPTNSYDSPVALAVDGAGNVFVTGSSNSDYATVKYGSAGNQVWIAHYNGPANNFDNAADLALDGAGNVYVTGYSNGGATGNDYGTVKYDSAGVQVWAARYNGPETNSNDQATSLRVVGGNVYVTGESTGVGVGLDFATVKYSSAGTQLWAARYNGPTNGSDSAAALALDSLGNVYITGYSIGPNSYDYTTIKYSQPVVDPTPAAQAWAAHFDGPVNSHDIAIAVAVDAVGSVYVTGYSDGGAATGYDYATVKYNSAGTRLWVVRYNGPGNGNDIAAALALDGVGNIYVTGYSNGVGTNADYATVKYDSAGSQKWVARYNGPANDSDNAAALAVDGGGNVYVTGVSQGGVATDFDYATVKYSSAGSQLWATRYDGPANNHDSANSLKIDGAGSVYVSGSSTGVGTQQDYATVKYDSAGSQLWAARYNGPTNSYDNVVALAVDGGGNAYVTGSSNSDYVTLKYDTAGNQVWIAHYNGPANSFDNAADLALDGVGNVYVTGYSNGGATGNDYGTVKYDSAGVQVWAARYNGPANASDTGVRVALDGVGNIYVTGTSYGGADTDTDYATVQYNSAGVELWAARYNGPASSSDNATALAVDGSGNAYVTGISLGPNGFDYATVKYNLAPPPPDTTRPACVVGSVVVESPTRVYLPVTLSDAGSGVAQVQLTTTSTNCKLEWSGPGGVVTVPIGGTIPITPAAVSTVVRAVKLNASQRARVELRVTDAAGNFIICDPVIANLEVKRAGAPLVRTFRGIPQVERYVTLQNGTPGLKYAALTVNGRVVSQGSLADGQVVSLDVAQWLRPGSRNGVRIAARGPKGATAVLTIGDVAPSAGAAVSAVSAAVNGEFAP